MKHLTAVGAAVAGAVATAALSGAGIAAAAPDVVGMTYDDAASAIENRGGTAVVATRTGSQLDQGDCIVTNVWDASFLREGTHSGREVQVALNCNGGVAEAGTPNT